MKKVFLSMAVSLLASSAFADVTNGEYLIKDAASGKFLGGANSWGTQASLLQHGSRFTLTKLENGTYNLDSHTYNNSSNHFFTGTYVDGGATAIYLTPAGSNFVMSTAAESAFLGTDGNIVENNVTSADAAIQWQFLTIKEATDAFHSASEINPVDATFLIKNAAVSRNLYNQASDLGWQGNPTIKGDNSNMNAEKFNCNFDVYQEISVPNGTYVFSCQGFYRAGGFAAAASSREAGTEAANAYLYANEQQIALPSIFADAKSAAESGFSAETALGFIPNSQADASVVFSAGLYRSDKVTVTVTNGTLRLGIKKNETIDQDWSIFDNFELYCVGLSSLSEYQDAFAALVQEAEELAKQDMEESLRTALLAACATPEQTAEAYDAAIKALTAAINNARLGALRLNYVAGTNVSQLAADAWVGQTNTFGSRAERYNTAMYTGDVMYQTISGLRPGNDYWVNLTASASYTSGRGFDGKTGDSLSFIYANADVRSIAVKERTGVAENEFDRFQLKATVGKDGVLTFGLKNVADGGNWFVIAVDSIVSAGNGNIASYSTVYISIDALNAAIQAAAAKIVSDKYEDLVKTYCDSLNLFANQVSEVAKVADSLYAELAMVGKADSLIALLPTVAQVEEVVTKFKAAITPVEEEEIGEKTLVEFYDFAAFVQNTPSTLAIGTDTIMQEGTNALPVFVIANPTNKDGETFKLKNRFAVNAGPSTNVTLRWMWRASTSNAYQNGLAGQWNGNGAAASSFNISVLNLIKGDTLTLNYSIRSGKPSQFHVCSSDILATVDGTALAAGDIVETGVKYVVKKTGNIDLFNTDNNVAINSVSIVTEPEKIEVTDIFDFAAFVQNTPSTLAIGTDTIMQEGTNALPVFVIANPTNKDGETFKLKNRFAVNAGPSTNVTLRWMWRASTSNAYQNGLAGQWNGNGAAASSFNISVLDLVKGDSIVMNYSIRSGKPAQFHVCSSDIIATADGTTLEAGEIMATGVKYVVKKTGRLDLYNTDNNVAINSVAITYKTTSLPAPSIVSEGDESGAVKVSIAEADGEIFYSLDGGETQSYTQPFYLTQSTDVAAWYVSNEITSVVAETRVKAGVIATPTIVAILSSNDERTVAIGTTTTAAYLIVNGDTVKSNVDTLKITSTTEFTVVANTETALEDTTYVMSSDTAVVTIEAGNTIQLNQVSVVKVSDSDTAWVFTVDNSSADIIGQPETQISYEVYPSGEKADVAHGDTLTFATHQRITLVANAEGYATSEPMIVWTREPAKLELVWSDDFKTNAETMVEAGTNYGPILQDPTFTIGSYTLCPVQYNDGVISNENFGLEQGTSWLQRNVNGYIGLYNYNSGPRRFGINNLRKTQVVQLTVQSPAEVTLMNDVLQLDETNSTANTLYYNCVKDGAALFSMSRYFCIWKVEVFNNPDVTASPNIYIAGKEGDARNVAIIPATVAYPVNQFTYYAISNGTRVDSTLVTAATDSTEAVYQVDTVTIFNDFAPIAGEFTVSKPNNTVIAYTEYEGKASEVAQVEIDCDSIYSLLLPTIAWNEKTAEGHVFTINNPNPIKSGLYPQLKVAYNGQSDIEYCNESLDCPVAGSGWLTVQAILPGMDTAYVVSRYVAEARESYNENYDAIIDGDTLTAGAYVGDIEIAAGAAVSGTYPTKAIAVTGTQFFHVAATENFSAVTLPFAFTPGKNVVTDAKGNELVAGEDYEIATLHNLANGNVPTGKDAANVANFTNMAGCVRTSDLTAGTAILFRALSEKVGAEVILVSDAKKPVAVAVTATTMPTSGWKIYGNKRMQNVALENSVYVLNAAGDKLVLTENPTIAPMGVALMAEAATVQALGNEILLVGDPSAIDVVEDAISQFEVNTVYDLQGRQVETLKKGQVYLINGRRYMVK